MFFRSGVEPPPKSSFRRRAELFRPEQSDLLFVEQSVVSPEKPDFVVNQNRTGNRQDRRLLLEFSGFALNCQDIPNPVESLIHWHQLPPRAVEVKQTPILRRSEGFLIGVRPQSSVFRQVFLANVLTHNQNHDQVIAQIRAAGPDVIAILELNSDLEKALNQQLATSHPYVVSESQDNGNFGIGLWSRFPLANERVFHLNTPILPSIEADVQLPSRAIHLVATHPLPPMGARNFNHRNKHLALLGQRIQEQFRGDPAESVILLGDLNLTPWSPLFHDFLAATDLQNSAAGGGLQPTWYRWNAFPFGLVLDHGLHSGNLRCRERKILPPNGSDHRALILDFSANDVH
jgi:endonuclease/exonuclease/phosphatase (EEP) superfamily protein YafD